MHKRDDDAELVESIEANKAFNVCGAEDGVNISAFETKLVAEVRGKRLDIVNELRTFYAQIHVLNSVIVAVLLCGFEIELVAVHVPGFTHCVVS